MIRALGRLFPGSLISSARAFKLVQPSYAHNVATVAKAIIPIIPPKLVGVLSVARDKSGDCFPKKRPAKSITAIGISFAIIDTFWRMVPALIPKQL